MRVVEEYFGEGRHWRGLLVEAGGARLYSVDVYVRLTERPGGCRERLAVGGVELCYADLGGGCEAVVSIAGGRVEVVNLRLRVGVGGDPFGGSIGRVREWCLERLRGWLGGAGEDEGGAEARGGGEG